MGRPRIDDGNAEFQNWLVMKGISPVTAKLYLSSVRYVIRNAKFNNMGNEEFLIAMQFNGMVRYSTCKTAWVKYCNWKGIQISNPHLRSGYGDLDAVDHITELPTNVLNALVTLTVEYKWPLKSLNEISWADVAPNGKNFLVSYRKEHWMVTGAIIGPLLAYAEVDLGQKVPLVPAKPKDTRPYPLSTLRILLADRKLALAHEQEGKAVERAMQKEAEQLKVERLERKPFVPSPTDGSRMSAQAVQTLRLMGEEVINVTPEVEAEIQELIDAGTDF